jgi:hypothetical protein
MGLYAMVRKGKLNLMNSVPVSSFSRVISLMVSNCGSRLIINTSNKQKSTRPINRHQKDRWALREITRDSDDHLM